MRYTGRRMDVRAKFVDSPSAQATTPGHSFASRREAYRLALDPEVERVTMNAGYNRLLRLEPGTISPNVRPDVGAVYFDGRVARTEVMSAGDIADVLRTRNTKVDVQLRNNNFNPLPPRVISPRVR